MKNTQRKNNTKIKILIFVLVLLIYATNFVGAWPGYRIIYKEQYYKLYHQQFYMYPENYAENIHWLENALRADFANPLYAMAKIETKEEWEWYRNHFTMHVNLLLTKNYLQWANRYIKQNAYFYNEPWKEENLKSLEKAKKLVNMAKIYWEEVLKNVEDIKAMNLHFMNLTGIQQWEDEYYRITHNEIDYNKIINREMTRIEKVSAEFENMDETTY